MATTSQSHCLASKAPSHAPAIPWHVAAGAVALFREEFRVRYDYPNISEKCEASEARPYWNEARRLRDFSPFAGVLSATERRAILRQCSYSH